MTQQKWTAADLPAMTGRTVVVTGASSGLGFVTARELAAAGARVVLAVRDQAKGHKAAAAMPGTTEARPLDLASLASVRAFAAAWTGRLDILTRAGSSVRSMAAHPGISKTSLASHVTGLEGLGLKILAAFAQDAEHGALPTLCAATAELPGGSYAGPDGPGERRGYPTLVQASQTARDSALARRLWDASSQLTGTGQNLPAAT